MTPQRVVLATGNAGKLREFAQLLAPAGFAFEPQSAFGIEPPEETGDSFLANALLKARYAARLSGLPAMADDSGLEVDALGGAPGVRSARYAEDPVAGLASGAGTMPGAMPGAHVVAMPRDEANWRKLLGALADVPAAARTARFRCCIALVRDADDPAPVVGEGAWEGRILDAPRGSGGFGYDPVFAPIDGAGAAYGGRTVAELDAATKNLHSHRAAALRALLAAWQAR
jgi:XTP/dITP diphosphohydrolase